MKCAIIDDEPLAFGLLESYVAKNPHVGVVWQICQCR